MNNKVKKALKVGAVIGAGALGAAGSHEGFKAVSHHMADKVMDNEAHGLSAWADKHIYGDRFRNLLKLHTDEKHKDNRAMVSTAGGIASAIGAHKLLNKDKKENK